MGVLGSLYDYFDFTEELDGDGFHPFGGRILLRVGTALEL